MIEDGRSTNMESLVAELERIPGMLTRERGLILYLLAYGSTLRGDVAEIGSWQGRSTCFLAAACRDAANGVVLAIDHFKGNVGKEASYIVGAPDLSDLEGNFRRNVRNAGLDPWVRLYAMRSQDAFASHPDDFSGLRLLFIDGDHSYEGAHRDLSLFADRLQRGGILVLDDYHSDAPGVVRAVRELVLNDAAAFSGFTQFHGFFVATKCR
jgi:predicted O-methyltransferase YrrM